MIDTALFDADLIAYRCAASAEGETQDVAEVRADELIRRILVELNATGSRFYLTGENNFRNEINPDYKANRKDQVRPRHLQAIREHLCRYYNAQVTDGIEADDALGIDQCRDEELTCIVSLDKDMKMVPGHHYSWEFGGTSSTGKKWVKDAEFVTVTPLQGLRHLYFQAIMGDQADNIFGYDGKARSKVPQFLQPKIDYLHSLNTESEMYDYVLDMYNGDSERLNMNLRCLYILQSEDGHWKIPYEEEPRQEAELQIQP
jgi:DNA polymerase-1